jgi:bifunctional oligoribonuclease and PAP phosphatase NrnA
MRYDQPDWDATVAALRAADELVIVCHVNPDGDALGSLLACSLGLQQLGKKTWPTWGSVDVRVPFNYRFGPPG